MNRRKTYWASSITRPCPSISFSNLDTVRVVFTIDSLPIVCYVLGYVGSLNALKMSEWIGILPTGS